MCDIYEDNTDNNKRKLPHIKVSNFTTINNDMNETNSLKSESPSSFINPPSPTFFLQNITFNSFPSLEYVTNKQIQIKNKSVRFLKVTNDLSNKINLLEEIYDGPEYKRLKMSNKLIECRLDEEASHKIVARLISKQINDNSSLCDRTVHPAYSTEEQDDDQTMDSSGLFKVPSTPAMLNDLSLSEMDDHTPSIEPEIFSTDLDQESQVPLTSPLVTEHDSLFLEHDGNTYIQVDDTNYHLVQSLTEDGVVITETGLQIIIPEGTEVPLSQPLAQSFYQNNNNYSSSNHNHSHPPDYRSPSIDPVGFYRENRAPTRKSSRNEVNPYFGHMSGSAVKPYSDYVALPLRPAPQTPFTLSSQLYTPELSISLTEQECELMLTIDSIKRTLPQQIPIYYQIYSYKDEDRFAKPTSEVWGLVGEIKACPLPMFCTISIPAGYHKHYFAIRSVDEFCRFSDWSNVVQVEVENNQHATNQR